MAAKKAWPKFHAYDSELAEEYPEHRRFTVAYEPYWQWVRINLRWATYENARISAARCDAYVATAAADAELKNRVWRVYNLLCAIPHGQSTNLGIRMIERSVTKILTPYMETYRLRLLDLGYPTEWDWADTRHQAQSMAKTNHDWLERTTEHLLANRSKRPHAKPELRHYLRICLDAMGIEDPLEWKKRS